MFPFFFFFFFAGSERYVAFKTVRGMLSVLLVVIRLLGCVDANFIQSGEHVRSARLSPAIQMLCPCILDVSSLFRVFAPLQNSVPIQPKRNQMLPEVDKNFDKNSVSISCKCGAVEASSATRSAGCAAPGFRSTSRRRRLRRKKPRFEIGRLLTGA